MEQWLANFQGCTVDRELEQSHALYLLSRFMYFGHNELRQMLRAMFLESFRNPLSVSVRSNLLNRDDFDAIHRGFLRELRATRFLGIGNPAESGTHLLYDFRLANNLPVKSFVNLHELFSGPLGDADTTWVFRDVTRIVFVDDFCGTGGQAIDFGRKVVALLRHVARRTEIALEVWYLTLLATESGLARIRQQGIYDHIASVSELDRSYRTFGEDSQIYENAPGELSLQDGRQIAAHYGRRLNRQHPLGYKRSQLLLGFRHNIPNNTLPIFSYHRVRPPWRPLFPRTAKKS